MRERIYLDHHTTTRPSSAAVAAMTPYLLEQWGVSTAPHIMGQELLSGMERAYQSIYKLLGAQEYDSFVFTSSGAEAINHVVWAAYFDRARDQGRNHFITSAVDDAPTILAMERLQQLGCELTLVPIDSRGQVTLEALIDALTPRTALVSLAWANGLTGVIQPVSAIAEVCRDRGIWFHLDATLVLGKLSFDLDEIGPDLLSFNGDQLHAPKGTGGLWMRSGLRLSPLILGGMEQDGQRAGSMSVALLAALGVAAQEAHRDRDHVAVETARLRDRLEQGLLHQIPNTKVLFKDSERLPTTTCLAFPGVGADALLYLLNRRGVLASFGGGVYQQLSLQLQAAGVHPSLAHCALSLSLSKETTATQIDHCILVIGQTVAELREISRGVVDGA